MRVRGTKQSRRLTEATAHRFSSGRVGHGHNHSYQVRDYTAWYWHITLAMLAHAYLSATRATAEKGGPQPEPSGSSR